MESIRQAFRHDVEGLSWIDEETKTKIYDKVRCRNSHFVALRPFAAN